MSIRLLRYLGDPVLRTPSDPVTRFDESLAGLIEDLLDVVQEPGRAGLAASQIGSTLAAFSYFVGGQLGYLNPRILHLDGAADGLRPACPSRSSALSGTGPLRDNSGVNLQQEQGIVCGTRTLA